MGNNQTIYVSCFKAPFTTAKPCLNNPWIKCSSRGICGTPLKSECQSTCGLCGTYIVMNE